MRLRSQFLLFWGALLIFLYQPFIHAGGTFDTLNPDQQRHLLNGNALSIYPATPSWPRCQIYYWIPVTPEEAAGVFFDYSNQKNYVHRVAKSEIIRTHPDQKTSEVAYGLKLAPILATFFPAPEYHVFSHIDQIQHGNPGYEVRWNLAKAGFLKDLKGAARFEPVETGTLISYWSSLEPAYLPYALAPHYVIESIKRGCREALESVATHIKTIQIEDPGYVQERVSVLKNTLGLP